MQLERVPNTLPILKIKREVQHIEEFESQDFELIGYNPQQRIAMEMAV